MRIQLCVYLRRGFGVFSLLSCRSSLCILDLELPYRGMICPSFLFQVVFHSVNYVPRRYQNVGFWCIQCVYYLIAMPYETIFRNLKTFLNVTINPGWRIIRSNIESVAHDMLVLRPNGGAWWLLAYLQCPSLMEKLSCRFIKISPIKQNAKAALVQPGKVTLLNWFNTCVYANEAASLCVSFAFLDPHVQFKNKPSDPSHVLDTSKKWNQLISHTKLKGAEMTR